MQFAATTTEIPNQFNGQAGRANSVSRQLFVYTGT